MHCLVAKCSDVSEECIASIFRVAEICSDGCRCDTEEEMCCLCGMVRARIVSHGYRRHGREVRAVLSQCELRHPRMALSFVIFTM